ncbi:unnamed protein product [Adineta steineri]|uniref:Uncharacterized protein n=1 Tax=Adineta steineri TaxID=433720 RepID=A0A818QMJ5_9BILA|nr:unnamed protein product [Adineta steineri]CAF1014700.1 unnamed protein product [Adineta steineri]CAF1027187.1 unnamed protein product [Adineta steineri]CAF3561404.1 unnamed protein product [Adineta steineri]CAF3619851.1 unnamed protein product [Adineta steineri]
MDQESAMMIFLSYQKLRMPTFSVRQRRTENPLRERLLVRKFIVQLETYYFQQQQQLSISTTDNDHMEVDQELDDEDE